VPASSWQAFDLQAAGLSDEVREWAETAVQPYTTLLEAVHATLDPGRRSMARTSGRIERWREICPCILSGVGGAYGEMHVQTVRGIMRWA
jgi:hypothetical protein